nr:uncharacterized protein LOC115268861 [Aedes albopictus]
MSRGSYQRRVQITALMCNEGYLWHETHMETFTGDVPGYWTKKMFSEKTRALELTRRARKSPNYSRRSKNALREKEVDYGEEAVEAAENEARETMAIDINTMRNKYKIHDQTRKKLQSCITITEIEELAKGRILTKFVSEIINARETSKWKKCESLLRTTHTWNFLKINRAVVGLVLLKLKEEHALDFDENKMFIDRCHEFLCCVPDAVSKDGTTILLVRRKESPGDIKEHASTSKGVLGCKLIDEEISLDRNTNVEIQTALHVCFSTRCIIFSC